MAASIEGSGIVPTQRCTPEHHIGIGRSPKNDRLIVTNFFDRQGRLRGLLKNPDMD